MPTEETPSRNSYLLDSENPAELARLINLDFMMTRAMGGPLAEQSPAQRSKLQATLDLGCGPGGWALDMAFSFPHIESAGVDMSRSMVDYANARARSQNLLNASFEVMDITKPLTFADASFDLLNARFLFAALPTALWPPFLTECTRLLRPGGILRLTEIDDMGITTSPTFERLQRIFFHALHHLHYAFSKDGNDLGFPIAMPQLLKQIGYPEVHIVHHALDISIGAKAWGDFYRNTEVAYGLGLPLFVKTGFSTKDEIEHLYTQMLSEIRADDFSGIWNFRTYWSNKPT